MIINFTCFISESFTSTEKNMLNLISYTSSLLSKILPLLLESFEPQRTLTLTILSI